MSTDLWVLAGQILALLGAIFTVVWSQRNSRRQPKVDDAEVDHTEVDTDRLRETVEQMNEKSNARRDIRIAQLHGYLLQDYEWHLIVVMNERKMLAIITELMHMIEKLGGDASHIVIPEASPPPPPIPPPPPVTD